MNSQWGSHCVRSTDLVPKHYDLTVGISQWECTDRLKVLKRDSIYNINLLFKKKGFQAFTVKTLYNVTHYNRIFNIRHIIAWNGSVSIKIPSL